MKIEWDKGNCKIDAIEITQDTLSNRGGLSFALRYIDSLGFFDKIEHRLGHLRKSSKADTISEVTRQIAAYFLDGSSHAISGFDALKKDTGYAAVLERPIEGLVSTATVKRYFRKFNGNAYAGFRSILNDLFVWRLSVEKPKVIILHLDTMVLDNDNAEKREGVNPTYKDVCGFQPLHINWGPYIIDMHFRSGEKHSNHGDDAKEAVARIVKLIRTNYDPDIPIIVSADSGFLSEENIVEFEEELKIHYVVMGRLYDSLYMTLDEKNIPEATRIAGEHASWVCYDFQSKLGTWEQERRTILTSMVYNDDQYILQGIRDSVMYTNLGTTPSLDTEFVRRGYANYLLTEGIVKVAHHNGEEELNHRSIKEFMGSEHLPFTHFGMNGAYYSLMVISHFLMESFRYDIAADIIPHRCYPTRLRREIIDIAVKFIKTGRQRIMKVTQTLWERLDVESIWRKCNCQPVWT